MIFYCCIASGYDEYVQVGTPNGPKDNPQDVGYVSPCSSQAFTAHFNAPPNSFPTQVLWYINGVLIKNAYELE